MGGVEQSYKISRWEKRFAELVKFRNKYGHCRVPRASGLGEWVHKQKHWRFAEKPNYFFDRLNSIQFEWEPQNVARASFWENNFNRLLNFKLSAGHCNVPRRFPKDQSLGSWVANQRANKIKLSAEQIKRLNGIGFQWSASERKKTQYWEENFKALAQFKKEHGHLPNSKKDPLSAKLCWWLSSQRQRKDRLSLDQIKRLGDLGVSWDPKNNIWEQHFKGLQQFKRLHGHTRVPVVYPKNKRLGVWVALLRQRKSKLTANQRRRLDALKFEWNPREKIWEKKFQELVQFKKRTGHCSVPYKFKKNPSLGRWVTTQRSRKNKLSSQQIKRLNTLKFQWRLRSK